MLSRVANSLYWMSRNIERADNNARVLRLKLIAVLEQGNSPELTDLDAYELLEICSSYQTYKDLELPFNSKSLVHYLLDEPDNPNSIYNCLFVARDNAKVTREIISQDLWEIINELYWYIKNSPARDMKNKELQQHLHQIIQYSLTVQGVVQSLLLRNVPFAFIQIGKWLERAEKTARIINVLCEHYTNRAPDTITDDYYYRWMNTLKFINGYDAYLKKYPPFLHTREVLTFLISDPSFPRSIAYCFKRIGSELHNLEEGKVHPYSAVLFDKLAQTQKIIAAVEYEDWSNLDPLPFLDDFQNQCQELSDMFSRTYYLVRP